MKILISSILLLIAAYVPARGGEVIWGATSYGVYSQGTPLPAGDLAEIGTFLGLSPDTVAANVQNFDLLRSNWTTFGTGHIGDGPRPPGFWRDDTVNSTSSLVGAPIYLWVFNSPDISSATEEGIFTGFKSNIASSAWLFPQDNSSITTDLGDLGVGLDIANPQLSGVIAGGIGFNETGLHFNTAPIPEPSTCWLAVAGVGLMFSVHRRSTA